MKTLGLLLVLLGAVWAKNPVSSTNYLNLYGSYARGTQFAKVPLTGVPYYDSYLRTLSKDAAVTVDEVIEGPVYVVMRNPKGRGLSQYYAARGLASILREPSMKSVQKYFLTPGEKAGIFFRPSTINDESLLKLPITRVQIPSKFKVGDLFRVLVGNRQIPVLMITNKRYVESLHLRSVDSLARLKVMPVEGGFQRIH
ncbi:hypothetical protein J6590_061355 [Homalodisca vitripennis]|nr:hypothetical protein J6590_061355 [Homalodisca vitripennis]